MVGKLNLIEVHIGKRIGHIRAHRGLVSIGKLALNGSVSVDLLVSPRQEFDYIIIPVVERCTGGTHWGMYGGIGHERRYRALHVRAEFSILE